MADEVSIEPLRRAAAELASALRYIGSPAAAADDQLRRHLRSGAIQCFEVAYELSVSTLRRVLAAREADGEAVRRSSFNQLIRLAYDRDLVRSEFAVWAGFRDNRNRTSHVYSESIAEATIASIPNFAVELDALIEALDGTAHAG